MPTTIKLSPSANATFTLPAGLSARKWFETNWKNQDINAEKSVAFAKSDIKTLLDQQCTELILSKQVHNGKKTLSMAGIDAGDELQDDNSSTMLLGNYFETPSGNGQFELDLNLFGQPEEGTWGVPYQTTDTFKNLIDNYHKQPYRCNNFSTVIFSRTQIANLMSPANCSKIAFVSGYIWINTEIQNSPNSGGLVEKSSSSYETLLAIAVDANDEVIGGPVAPTIFWPPKYKTYS